MQVQEAQYASLDSQTQELIKQLQHMEEVFHKVFSVFFQVFSFKIFSIFFLLVFFFLSFSSCSAD